jgi:hypothetical protein
MLDGDKCNGNTPVLDRTGTIQSSIGVNVEGTASTGKENIDFKPRVAELPNVVTPPPVVNPIT